MAELAAHARHDPLRVAEAIDRGARLAPVLDLCARCAALYADLVALTMALPMAALPARPRDFILTDGDARQLGARAWRGWWTRVGTARDLITRPLAIGFTTFGLIGVLVTAAPALLPSVGSAGGSEMVPMMGSGAAPAPSPQPRDVRSAGTDYSVVVDASPGIAVSGGLLALGSGLFTVRRIATRARRVR